MVEKGDAVSICGASFVTATDEDDEDANKENHRQTDDYKDNDLLRRIHCLSRVRRSDVEAVAGKSGSWHDVIRCCCCDCCSTVSSTISSFPESEAHALFLRSR